MVALLLLVGIVGAVAYGNRRRDRLRQSGGVPDVTIEDYGSRRLARGSVPPPMSATQQLAGRVSMSSLAIRPKLRPLTPQPVDGRWDLSDQAKSRR